MNLKIPNDSYISLEEANDYHALRSSFEAWDGLDEPTKKRRLVSASDYLDVNYLFSGEKAEANQPRQFPRKGFEEIPIPQAVKYAVCELALNADLNQNPEQKMSSVKVGPVSVNYDEKNRIYSPQNRYEYVKQLLTVWLDNRNGMSSVKMERG